MFYAVNGNTKEHRVIPYGEPSETLVKADSEGWIEWRGGECPLPQGVPCKYKMRNRSGVSIEGENALNLFWDHGRFDVDDIIAYLPLVTESELKEGDPCQYYDKESGEWRQAVYVNRFIVVDGDTVVLVEPWQLKRLSEKHCTTQDTVSNEAPPEPATDGKPVNQHAQEPQDMDPIQRLNAARRDLDAAQKEHDEALSAVRRQLSGYNVEVDTTTVNPNKKNTDNQALLEIQEILSAVEWTPDTPEQIASIMQEAGYNVEDTK